MNINNLNMSVTEQFTVLSLLGKDLVKPKKIEFGSNKIYIVSSIFIDLLLENKIELDEKQIVVVKDSSITGITYKDAVIEILNTKKKKDFKKCIEYFYYHIVIRDNIYQNVLDEINKKNILTMIGENYRDSYNVGDFIVQRIRAELLEDGTIDEDIIYLALILDRNNLLMCYFSEYECKSIKDKMSELKSGELGERIRVIRKSVLSIEVFSLVSLIFDIVTGLV